MMQPLSWTPDKTGNLNGKVGPYTLFTVAFHTGERAFFVFPKLPGLKSVRVGSPEEGRRVAAGLWRRYFKLLAGLAGTSTSNPREGK